jgi:UDP-glucuronate decarboxylase
MHEHILITGGSGFIGLHLARAIVARGGRVTLVDNFFRHAMDDALQALLPAVTLVEHDLTQPLPADRLGGGYTHVYHLAAIVGVRYSNEVPHQVLRTNLLSTINVLDWCARQPHIAVCFASTSEVYAGAVGLGQAAVPTAEATPLTIVDPMLPRASYAESKIAGEMLCLNYARAYTFPIRIMRYHNVYGPRMGYEHVIPQFIQRILEQQDPFAIYGAYQRRAFCYVDDAVEATLRLMALPNEEQLIVNIGNDQQEIQIKSLAAMLFAIAGVGPTLSIQPAPPGSPERRCPDLSSLRQLTGFTPQVDLEDGLRRTFEWYRHTWEQRKYDDTKEQRRAHARALYAPGVLPDARRS